MTRTGTKALSTWLKLTDTYRRERFPKAIEVENTVDKIKIDQRWLLSVRTLGLIVLKYFKNLILTIHKKQPRKENTLHTLNTAGHLQHCMPCGLLTACRGI